MDLGPLFALRLRTPRLELRLPTEDELLELFHVAEAGIHPPEEMPFEIPWTDTLAEDAFLAFHHEQRDHWSPERWACNFVTFLDGRVIGTQAIEAEGFAGERRVQTGSWLGQAFQRRGYGLEQRAAVLEHRLVPLAARVGLERERRRTGLLEPRLRRVHALLEKGTLRAPERDDVDRGVLG